jgi:hypothetical protein
MRIETVTERELPMIALEDFLQSSLREAWIASFTWYPAKRSGLHPKFSKSHKENPSGELFQVEVESVDCFRAGVDLEYFDEARPLFQNPGWLERKLKISENGADALVENMSPRELLEEWAYREAAFKALYPFNSGIVLSDFVRPAPHRLEVEAKNGKELLRFVFDIRGQWEGKWFLALARRSL